MGKVALVTGGAGFIGSHLAKRLAELGYEVKVFDVLITKAGQNMFEHPNISYYNRDITQPALDDFRCDWVFHLAGLADIIPSIKNPYSYFHTNTSGTINLLEHSVRLGVKKFIYASSTSIYGIPAQYPTPETAPANPEYPYALSKWLGEQAVTYWNKMYHLPTASLRITTAYGLGMRSRGAYGSVMKVFLPQKANDMPFTVVGNGTQSRDFVWVDDICDAFIKVAESDVSGEVFNVGFGQPRTINDLVGLLGDGNQVVLYLPKRPGEPDMTWADITKIKSMIGWEPKVTLEEGMKIMLEHLDEWKNEPVWTPEKIEEATKEWFQYLRK